MRVVAVLLAEDHEHVYACGDFELGALDAGERLERRAGRAPAVRAMAVRGIEEFVRHHMSDGAAVAFSGKHARTRFAELCHRNPLAPMSAEATRRMDCRGHSDERGPRGV